MDTEAADERMLRTTTRDEAIEAFGVGVVGAMDEVAELIFATRHLVDAVGEYQTLGIYKQARPVSGRIEQVLHAVCADLLDAIRLGGRESLPERLAQVRKANALRLAQAGKDAASLAALEGEQVGGAGPEAVATSSLKLQHRIERVVAAWATL